VDFALSSIDMSVSIAYLLSEVAATFHPQKRLNQQLFQSGYQLCDYPLRHSLASPFLVHSSKCCSVVVSTGHIFMEAGTSMSVTGHLILQFDIGLSAFGDIVSSAVFLKVNAQ
jgi:hypothetical protein